MKLEPYTLVLPLPSGENIAIRMPREMSLADWNKMRELLEINLVGMKSALVPECAHEAIPDGGFPHDTVPMLVWADIDKGIAADVEYLNQFENVRTMTSCEGSLAAGGNVRPYVMISWTGELPTLVVERYERGDGGDHWTYLYPHSQAVSV